MKRKPRPQLPGFASVKRRRTRVRITDWTIPHEPPAPPDIPNINDRRKAKVR